LGPLWGAIAPLQKPKKTTWKLPTKHVQVSVILGTKVSGAWWWAFLDFKAVLRIWWIWWSPVATIWLLTCKWKPSDRSPTGERTLNPPENSNGYGNHHFR
jgi:hypothetical protein